MNLQEISMMAQLLIEGERDIEATENLLSAQKERARNLREETIPMAMQELGLESIELSTGEKVSVAQEVYASIPVANREDAYAWLESRGFGGIIKTEVVSSFGKGEIDKAKEAVNLLRDSGVQATMSRSVHAQTLKAFCKEQLATGKELPMELLGCRPTWTTKVKH